MAGRLNVSVEDPELKALFYGSQAVGISRDELAKAMAVEIKKVIDAKVGKHKVEALGFRKNDLAAKIAELQAESNAIDNMLSKK